jgi:tetratricopeptide (TPR) repeat protein
VVQERPDLPFADALGRARSMHGGGDLNGAIDLYRRLLAQSPDHPRVLTLLGTATLQAGRTSDGLALLMRSLELQPKQVQALINLATGFGTLGRHDAALSSLNRALACLAGCPRLLDRPDSPWYPTATLFRQAAPGDWGGTIRRVAADRRLLGATSR